MIFEKIRERLQETRNQLENSCLGVRSKEDCGKYIECGVCIMEAAIDIVNEVEVEYNNGWISCSERLPDVEADVLLSLRSLDIYTGFRANTEGCFYVEGEGYVEYDNVLAWQPLPKPYTPKGE